MVDQPVEAPGAARPERHLQGIERQVGPQRARRLPADHEARADIHDEGDVDPAAVGLDVGQVGHPQAIRRRRPELAGDQIERPVARLVADRGPDARLAADHASQAELAHEPLDRAAGDRDPLALELRPDLVGAVHLAVLVPDPPDRDLQDLVSSPARRRRPADRGVVAARGDLQHPADRLDSPARLVLGDEPHGFGKRGSSSRAKKADAAFRISFARRSSRFSRSRSRIALALAAGDARPLAVVDGIPSQPLPQASPASSPASRRSTRSPPTPTGARPGAPAPAASPAHAARAGTSWLSSWLHPLKLRSLQETRGGSVITKWSRVPPREVGTVDSHAKIRGPIAPRVLIGEPTVKEGKPR